MVRESMNGGSRHAYADVFYDGATWMAFVPFYRATTGGATTPGWDVYTTCTVPDSWVRLQRVGSDVMQYYGTDGTNWTLQRTLNTATWSEGPLAQWVMVGIATLSKNWLYTVKAQVSDFGPIVPQPTLPASIVTPPANTP